jgi:Protein of unknown function (DUF1579)
MKKQLTTLMAASFLLMGSGAIAQQMDKAAQEKAWKEYMTPGTMQKMLAMYDGKWTAETTMWMDPKAPPTKSNGTCVNKMIMGGRYQESTFSGTMMNMPFEGKATTGYDNATKKFVSTWIDNMGTGIMYMEGAYDAKSKTMELYGKCTDPMTGNEMKTREVMTFTDANHQKMEMYMTMPDGSEMKNMEVNYTRAK